MRQEDLDRARKDVSGGKPFNWLRDSWFPYIGAGGGLSRRQERGLADALNHRLTKNARIQSVWN